VYAEEKTSSDIGVLEAQSVCKRSSKVASKELLPIRLIYTHTQENKMSVIVKQLEKQLAFAKKCIREVYSKHHAHFIAHDFMCYPQLNPNEDPFADEGETYAQKIRAHIEHCVIDDLCDHEDPKQTVIY
jgi:hypothetical protein